MQINQKKSILAPTLKADCLGFLFDLEEVLRKLPPEKKNDI